MTAPFAKRLRDGEKLVGTIVTLDAPEIAEVLSASGLDWLFIDTEHAALDCLAAQRVLMASKVPCVVRVGDAQESTLKKALDTGAAGVVIPMVNTAVMAKAAVQFCKYPPVGRRGVGMVRAQGYGFGFAEYVSHANDNVALIAQIEHITAVDNIDVIVKVEGLDALFIGPYDLSGSMGKLGQVDHPEVVAAIEKVRAACEKAGRRLGIYCSNPQIAKPYVDRGYTLVAVGFDAMLLGAAARSIASLLKGTAA